MLLAFLEVDCFCESGMFLPVRLGLPAHGVILFRALWLNLGSISCMIVRFTNLFINDSTGSSSITRTVAGRAPGLST